MKLYYALLIIMTIITSFVLTSCSNPPAKEEEPILNDQATKEAAVFKYPKGSSARIYIGPQPVETSLGFIRFAGAIVSETSKALIEIGGRGTLVSVGQSVGDYRVDRINEGGVFLCLKNL